MRGCFGAERLLLHRSAAPTPTEATSMVEKSLNGECLTTVLRVPHGRAVLSEHEPGQRTSPEATTHNSRAKFTDSGEVSSVHDHVERDLTVLPRDRELPG
jgi:hypothetical protein